MVKSTVYPFHVDMQESEYFGEMLFGHVFSDVELRYPSDGSVFWMLLGIFLAFRKVLCTFHIYASLTFGVFMEYFVEYFFESLRGRFLSEAFSLDLSVSFSDFMSGCFFGFYSFGAGSKGWILFCSEFMDKFRLK